MGRFRSVGRLVRILVFWDNELHLVRKIIRNQPAYELTVSPGGRFVAGFEKGGREKDTDTIHVWEMLTGTEVLQITPNDARATAISFSPDSKQLLVGYDRGMFEIWELK